MVEDLVFSASIQSINQIICTFWLTSKLESKSCQERRVLCTKMETGAKGLNVMAYELAPRADSSAGLYTAWEEPFVNFLPPFQFSNG
jgi:hypothetical protein